jgi:hypothetical protein
VFSYYDWLAKVKKLPACPVCKYPKTATSNTYVIDVKSTAGWGYVRDQLQATLLKVYKKYGVTDLKPAVSGPSKQTRKHPSTVWRLVVVVPAKKCQSYKEALRSALLAAVRTFKKPPTIISTKLISIK